MLGPGDLWYKDAIIYSLNIESFQDSDGDGVGDIPGLTSRVDYLDGLGVTCIWLLPFYPSPNRDNRYDVTDHYGVDPRLGTLGDLVDFLRAARERGLRVMIDLVVNHTSDQHPWFQEARADPESRYRDYYVWADTPPPTANSGMVFPGVEESTWTFDPVAGAYYFHRFYAHQPDLNLANPAVREEIRKIMGFWLELGVSGFRVDAAPFLIDLKGVDPGILERRRPHTFFRHMRNFLSWRRGDAALLAEANVLPDEVAEYVGAGDRLHMVFNFWVNQRVFLALASGTARPLAQSLRELPVLPATAQWANFLRNHDELDLGRLTSAEREATYAAFAPDPSMRLYERGIRRRLAPMLANDRRGLELAHSLLLSLPGTPVLRYGDEIGMGDDLSRPERDSVRTPMQWERGPSAGFSTARTVVRPIVQGEYGPDRVNVADQRRDPASLLNWIQRALRVRKSCREIGWQELTVLDVGDDDVLALQFGRGAACIITLHNLAPRACVARLSIPDGSCVTELLSDSAEPADWRSGAIPLDEHGYRWARVRPDEGDC